MLHILYALCCIYVVGPVHCSAGPTRSPGNGPRNAAFTMDSKWVNMHCKKSLGFFLTSSADAHGELDVLDEAVAFIFKRLRDNKIRSGNVLNTLAEIEPIADHAAEMIAVSSKARGIPAGGEKAFAYAIIYNIIGVYHFRVKKMLETRGADGRAADREDAKADSKADAKAKADAKGPAAAGAS